MATTLRCLVESADIGTTAASAYQSAAGTRTTFTKLTVTNRSGASANFSAYILPSGVTAVAAQYLVISGKAVDAGATYDASELRSQTLEPGDSLWLVASASASLTARVNGQTVS